LQSGTDTLLTVLGTLGGVAVGALLATWRQSKQMAHDRELHELEALMKVIDDGAVALGDARVSLNRLARFWAAAVPVRSDKMIDAQERQRATVGKCEAL
jgi:hypothetical protein